MKTKKKTAMATRLVSLLLAVILVATMVPALALATGTEEPVTTGNEQGTEGGDGSGEGLDGDSGNEGQDAGGEDGGESNGTEGEDLNLENQDALQGEDLSALGTLGTLSGDISTLSATDEFTSIDLVASTDKVQTFTNLANGTTSTDAQLTLTVQLQPKTSYVEGGRIELPLDYNPTSQGLEDFTYGTDGTDGYGTATVKDFFTLDEAALLAEIGLSSSIIKTHSIKIDPIKGKILVLELKSAAEYSAATGGGVMGGGVKTFQLAFIFNNAYDSKIPVGTIMWKPQAAVYSDNGTPADTTDDTSIPTAVKQVGTSVTTSITTYLAHRDPGDENYLGGGMTTRFQHNNNNWFQSDFDPSYTSRIWIEVPTGTTSSSIVANYPDGMDTIDGYDRYYKNVANDGKVSWVQWQEGGNVTSAYNMRDIPFVIPESITAGMPFEVRAGADYQKINGKELTVVNSISYTKQIRPAWSPYLSPYHGDGGASQKMVCGLENGNVGTVHNAAPNANWGNNALKNLGSESVRGVVYELFQASDDAAKVNFNTIILYATRDNSDRDNMPVWSSYRYEIWVTDTQGGSPYLATIGNFTPSTTAYAQAADFNLPLPTLGSTEYISSVKVIPTGTSGLSDGEWTSMNGFALYYTAKAWNDKKWPNGDTISNTTTSVPMQWKLSYADNPSAPNAYPDGFDATSATKVIHTGDIAYVYYSSLQPYAQANLVSLAAVAGVNAGSTVSYTLNGYNNSNMALGPWVNPRIIVRVPDIMTLKDVNSSKTLTDAASGDDYTAVSSLLGTSGGYKYYSFAAPGYSAPKVAGQVAVFSIPLEFEIAATATPTTYAASLIRTVVTTTSPSTFYGSFDLPLNGDLEVPLATYGLAEGDNYSIVASPASSSLKVLSRPNLDVTSAVSSGATNDLYVTSELVPAEHGEQTKMMLSIKNAGNVSYTGIRLYNILPFENDNLDSEGTISFGGLTITGASSPTIRSTTADPTTLPLYGLHAGGAGNTIIDLQTATFQNSSPWTGGNPSSSSTAFFLNFGSQELAAGQEILIELLFDIPGTETGDQTAYNQFAYSAKEVGGSAAPLNSNAPRQGFSTATIALIYHGDDSLPALYASGGALEGESDLANVPTSGSASFTVAGQTLAVDAKVPTLTGYTFKGWSTTQGADTPDAAYDPGDTVTFSTASTINLYPVWELNEYEVSYEYTGSTVPAGVPDVPDTETYNFYELVTLATEPSTTPSAALAGYTFSGWNSTSAGVNVQGGTFNLPDNTVVFEGSWTANTNSITYAYTGTVPEGAADHLPDAENGIAFGTEMTVSPTPSTTPNVALPGYTFSGWTSTSAGVTVDAQGKFTMPDNAVVFEGSWTVNASALSYAYAGDVPLNVDPLPVATNVSQGTEVTIASAPTAVAGYSFGGWVPTAGITAGDISNGKFTMPNNAVTFTGTWTKNTYQVSYEYTNTVEGAPALPTTQTGVAFASTFNVASAPTLGGYTFSGWSSDDVTIESGSFSMPAKNVVIKGTWTPASGISFKVEHYKVTPLATTLAYTSTGTGTTGASVNALDYLQTFAGYTLDEGHADSKPTGTIAPDGSLTLELYYAANTNTAYKIVHYKVDSTGAVVGTPETENKTGTTDTTSALATEKTYTGYTFDSSYPGTSLSDTVTADGLMELALYYPSNRYTVSYGPNGGTGTTADTPVRYGELYTPAASGFSRSGYTFQYWTNAQGGARVDAGVQVRYETPGNTTLNAFWTADSDTPYKVEHYLVSAAGAVSLNHTDNLTGTTDTTATAVARTYASHTFASGDSRNIVSGNIDGNGTRVLKLYYTQNVYTVNFVDWNGATLASRQVAYGENALAPASPARVGYTFAGWDRGYTNITANTTVRATYNINYYTVTFVDYNGTTLSAQSVAYGGSASAPANPSRTGYTFSGWDRGYTGITSNITVTATYAVQTFTVTFLGYNDVVLQTSTVEYGGSATPPADPTRSGFRFTGWSQNSSAWTNVTADVTIRATWTNETVTPVTPPVEGGGDAGDTTGGTTAELLAEAANEQGIPSIGVPLAAPAGFAAWALGNLVLALLGVVLALVFAILRQFRKNIHNEVNGGGNNIRSIGWVIATIAFAVAGAVVFIITQDITLPMVWFDGWSIVSLVFFVGVLVLGSIAIGRKHVRVEEDAAPETM